MSSTTTCYEQSSSSSSTSLFHHPQHHQLDRGEEEEVEEEEEYDEEDPLIYLPPPPCWFQFEEDNTSGKENEKESTTDTIEQPGDTDANLCSVVTENTLRNEKAKEAAVDKDDMMPSTHLQEQTLTATTTTTGENNATNNISKSDRVVYWKHQVTNTLPTAAQELLSTSIRRAYYYTRLSYASHGCYHLRHSDLGNTASGSYFRVLQKGGIVDATTGEMLWKQQKNGEEEEKKKKKGAVVLDLPPFSSLPWVDRQLVAEWRTFEHTFDVHHHHQQQQQQLSATNHSFASSSQLEQDDDDEMMIILDNSDFEKAQTFAPKPLPPPSWENASSCYTCNKPFSPTLLRHHCRLCGHSYCHPHSNSTHKLPHFGYDPDVPERVCTACKHILEQYNLAERIAWRMARCRDFLNHNLTPYFETGVDTVEDAAYRLTRAAIKMARSIPLGAQAHVAVETIEVLRKHGLKGVYGLVLRKEFMAAADLLCKVTGINKKAWPLSVHELSAAIFYALAQHRGNRGLRPEREHLIHALMEDYPDCGGGDDDDDDDNVGAVNHDEEVESKIKEEEKHCGDDANLNNKEQEEEEKEEEDDEGGDTIVWSKTSSKTNQNPILDETDTFDPFREENFLGGADLLAMSSLPPPTCTTTSRNDSRGLADHVPQNSHDNYGPVSSDATTNITIRIRNEEHFKNNNITHSSPSKQQSQQHPQQLPFKPVCERVSDTLLSSLIFYAPLALNFIYATSEVDMQLLAAQQGWRLLYAHLQQHIPGGGDASGGHGHGYSNDVVLDRPASALFVHETQKIACFAIRGTATINDVVTDIRAMPVPFPEVEESEEEDDDDDDDDGTEDGIDDDMDNMGTPKTNDHSEGWTPIKNQGQGLALCGMARASTTLFRENIDALTLLAKRGYRIRITGHSLGGGVAALMGALVKRHFEKEVAIGTDDNLGGDNDSPGDNSKQGENDTKNYNDGNSGVSTQQQQQQQQQQPKSQNHPLERKDLLRVYGYGTPSCVDAKLSDFTQSYVTSVVMHDDVVPRLTPTSIRCLLKHLLHIRETWVKAHLTDDLMAITERAKTAWAPRWRGGFTLLATSSAKKIRHYKSRAKYKLSKKLNKSVLMKGGGEGSSDTVLNRRASARAATIHNGNEDNEGDTSEPRKTKSFSKMKNVESTNENNKRERSIALNGLDQPTDSNTKDGMFANDGNKADANYHHDDDDRSYDDHDHEINQSGMLYDGDKFFEAEEILIETDSESENSETRASNLNSAEKNSSVDNEKEDEGTNDWVPFDEPPMTKDLPGPKGDAEKQTTKKDNSKRERSESKSPVMLEEVPLHRMFIPGKIVHVYTHRGAYKAAFVPRAFRELRRVSLAGNMLTDHTSNSYYEGLLEVQSVRNAVEDLPEWTGYGEEITCSCCASCFTWASTSDSEAQEARDKHNCRACGSLVCGPCSKNRVPIPSIGITVLVRVCDRCYNDRGAILADGSGRHGLMMRSYIEESNEGHRSEERLETFQFDGSVIDDSTEGSAHYLINEDGSIIRKDQPVPNNPKKENARPKRSLVVDELASRLRTSVSTC